MILDYGYIYIYILNFISEHFIIKCSKTSIVIINVRFTYWAYGNIQTLLFNKTLGTCPVSYTVE